MHHVKPFMIPMAVALLLVSAANAATKTVNLRSKDRNLMQTEEECRVFDLLLEYSSEDLSAIDQSCIKDAVKEYLPVNIYEFMLSEGEITPKQKDEFMQGWNVQEVTVEEVEVIEAQDIDHPCEGSMCTVTEIAFEDPQPCQGEQCLRRFLQKRLRTTRRKKRIRTTSTSTCTMCYPDASDDRQLWGWGGSSRYGDSGEEDSGDGGEETSGEEEESDKESTYSYYRSQETNEEPQVTQEQPKTYEADSTQPEQTQTTESIAPQEERTYQGGTTTAAGSYKSDGSSLRTIITLLVEAVNRIIQHFQEIMGLSFRNQIEIQCPSGTLVKADFIYIPK